MATSGTTAFDLDFTDIAEEAWERAGREMRSGYDLATARRSMNLMMIEWQNQRGVNLWTVDSSTVSLTSGTATYNLPADTVDLLDQTVRTGSGATQSDLSITRIGRDTYSNIPAKNATGRPTQVYIDRQLAQPTITVWPVPDSNDYTFVYWRTRRIEDAGSGAQNPDVVFRFYPALVAGLAYYIAMKVPELTDRLQMLEAEYNRQFSLATAEDRTKSTWHIKPRMNMYRGL